MSGAEYIEYYKEFYRALIPDSPDWLLEQLAHERFIVITDLEAKIKEVEELRKIFPAILEALGNGAWCSETVSLGFLQEIPKEVKGVVEGLKREREASEQKLSSIYGFIKRNEQDGFIDSLSYTENLQRIVDRLYEKIESLERSSRLERE